VIDYPALLRALVDQGVRFIIVGGAAATAHGSARLTQDLDVVYERSPDNFPFAFDAETLRKGLDFTLTSKLGDVDLLGEIAGGGGYAQLEPHSIEIELFGVRCRCLGLDKLIEVKRAAGRPKDLEAIAELEAIREERRSR
jgi:predicted nucleotidyltransferase